MEKKTNLQKCMDIVTEVRGDRQLDRQCKNEILAKIKEVIQCSPNNASVYMAKAVKQLEQTTK